MLPLVTGRNATDCSVSSLAGANLQCSSVQGRGIKQPQLILCKAVTPRARLSRNERHSTACPSLCIFLLLRKQVLGTQISSFKQAMQSKGQRCPCDTQQVPACCSAPCGWAAAANRGREEGCLPDERRHQIYEGVLNNRRLCSIVFLHVNLGEAGPPPPTPPLWQAPSWGSASLQAETQGYLCKPRALPTVNFITANYHCFSKNSIKAQRSPGHSPSVGCMC